LIINAILLGRCIALLLAYASFCFAELAAYILPSWGDLLPVIVRGIIFAFIVSIGGMRGLIQALSLNDWRLL
jgi:hypothetical protein